MCAIEPFFEFEVPEPWLDRSLKAIAAAKAKLSQDQVCEVFFELGFGDAMNYTLDGELQLSLTNLQLVAVAAAIAAAADAGGRMVERR